MRANNIAGRAHLDGNWFIENNLEQHYRRLQDEFAAETKELTALKRDFNQFSAAL